MPIGTANPAYDAQSDKLIGQTLANRYEIEKRLGEGAMGAVYRARHIKVGRPFAVKVLHARLLADDKLIQRFTREAELAGRLHHPNVIGVVDVGELPDGTRYMVMDFAEGRDLASLLDEAPLPPQRIINLTRQLLEGLYHAHEHGLIHRDFKPENVIVQLDNHGVEVPRIVDFGIAILREGGESPDGPGRLTTNGLVLGTPHYMAPEQAVADPIDHRIDLFALGIIIYEMLSGRLPFDGNGAEVARANLLLDPPRIVERVPYLEVDPLLEAFSRRLMAKKRDMRPATAKAARELLDLIERDRDAAAAVLGVPLETARQPQLTQPVSPPHIDVTGRTMEAPAPPAALIAPSLAPRAPGSIEHSIETMPTRRASPPMSARSKWLIAGALVLAAGGSVVYVATRGGGHDTPPVTTQGPAPAPIATATPPPAPVTPPATPTPPAVSAEPTGSVAPIDSPAPAPTPVVPSVTTSHKRGTPSTVKASQHVQPAPTPAASQPTPAATATTPPPPVTPVAATKPAVVTPAAAPPGKLDAGAFSALYRAVGAELKAYGDAKGSDAASDLKVRYSRIRFSNAMASQAERDDATVILTKIRADMAARR